MNPSRRAILGLTVARPVCLEVDRAYRAIRHRSRPTHPIRGIGTGLAGLDALLGGLKPGQLVIAGAAPGIGKTGLAATIGCNAALQENTPVSFFSLSMSREELAERMVAAEARVPSCDLLRGTVDADGWSRLSRAVARLRKAPIAIEDPPLPTIADIRTQVAQMRGRWGRFVAPAPALVVIDDLHGLTTPAERQEPRGMKTLLTDLRSFARDSQVAILLLWPLPWLGEGLLATLDDFNGYQSFADAIVLIHREAQFDCPGAGETAELTVTRSRSGRTGMMQARFVKEYARFEEMLDQDTGQGATDLAISSMTVNGARSEGRVEL